MTPKSAQQVLVEHREQVLALAERHGYRDVRVFGSVVRGEARPDSDIDFLVVPLPRASALDHAALELDLEDLLGFKVDVVSEGALHRLIRDKVLAEARAL